MKLNLNKEWYEERIPREADLDVTAGIPVEDEFHDQREPRGQQEEGGFAEFHAFGSLVQLLRRNRSLTVEQLSTAANIDVTEVISIECDAKYAPKPRTVHQLATYFELPDRSLIKLSNLTTVHSAKLRDAVVRFAANSSTVMELSREERQALTEFVGFLSSEGVD